MYYCKSRYYVPEWCRWLNADSIANLDLENLDGLNLFAYCGNDPIMYVDEEGDFAAVPIAIGLMALFTILSIAMLAPEISEDIAFDMSSELKSFGDFIAREVTQTIAMTSLPFVLTFVALDNVMMSKQTGNQRDSGLAKEFPDTPDGNDRLEKKKNKARKEGNVQLARLLEKEQKARGQRNKRKKRGGPHMRGILYLLLLNETIRRY